jgi:hypothetical protein
MFRRNPSGSPPIGAALVIEKPSNTLFINGEAFKLDENTGEFGRIIAKGQNITTEQAKSFTDGISNRKLLLVILNKGYWYIE